MRLGLWVVLCSVAAVTVVRAQDAAALQHTVAPPAATRAAVDPQKCVVVLEEMGDVGFRIADAQAAAEAVATHLRKRVGRDGVVYQGVQKSQLQLQTMLGKSVETPAIQQEQLDYFAAAEKNAPWRVRVRFGANKKAKHPDSAQWITATCLKKGTAAVVDTLRVEARTFLLARDKLSDSLAGFCLQLPAVTDIPMEGVSLSPSEPVGMHKKALKPWSAPPPRK